MNQRPSIFDDGAFEEQQFESTDHDEGRHLSTRSITPDAAPFLITNHDESSWTNGGQTAMKALRPAIDNRLGVAFLSPNGNYLKIDSSSDGALRPEARRTERSSDSQFYLEQTGDSQIAIFNAERGLYLGLDSSG